MDTIHNVAYRLIGKVVFSVALFGAMGCSQQAAPKPQEGSAPQKIEAKQQTAKATPAKTQDSSLQAFQKGTLGKGADAGPLQDINFDFDRYDLRPDAKAILNNHAAWLKAHPSAKVVVEGHCDDRGTSEYNLALGAKRAETVRRYLLDLGASPNTLSNISYGEELPLCKEQNAACWAKNRRAHFVVTAAAPNI
jgi:peptidoglycan-associated lipoprotein